MLARSECISMDLYTYKDNVCRGSDFPFTSPSIRAFTIEFDKKKFHSEFPIQFHIS